MSRFAAVDCLRLCIDDMIKVGLFAMKYDCF
jgi:hypothetical protein